MSTPATGLDPGVRLHVVTGKGGTGKTTVAAALALALASRGRKVLLVEVEGRGDIATAFDVSPLGEAEELVLRVSGGGEVWGLSVDAKAALIEYLRLFYRLGAAGGVLERLGAIDFATTIAPGVRDVLLIGKVYEAVGRTSGERYVYDDVVLDAPPTGRVGRFLDVNREVADLAKVGPIRHQADSITALLRSPATVIHLVTLLEEMPVQETVEAAAELSVGPEGRTTSIGLVVVNQAREPMFDEPAAAALVDGGVGPAEVAATLGRLGLPADPGTVAGLLRQGRDHVDRLDLEDGQLAALETIGAPVVVLPHLLDPSGSGSIRELAQELADQARFPDR
ncbi:ArsA-related P-loop ATPase [Agilicoccus flavus]|uniref:ArsA-related P-loop ATPase n=1 Tax=Agilicoccus flavus TaxID=2775968 RepID=UPI001CF6A722|nr:ArsA-related P-loop ATPase [Agilicoccus flavus]